MYEYADLCYAFIVRGTWNHLYPLQFSCSEVSCQLFEHASGWYCKCALQMVLGLWLPVFVHLYLVTSTRSLSVFFPTEHTSHAITASCDTYNWPFICRLYVEVGTAWLLLGDNEVLKSTFVWSRTSIHHSVHSSMSNGTTNSCNRRAIVYLTVTSTYTTWHSQKRENFLNIA